jgi:Zn-dependent protease with chaperone function
MDYRVTFKENFYFVIKLVVALAAYAGIAFIFVMFALYPEDGVKGSVGFGYVALFLLYLLFRHGLLIGYLRGNAVRVADNQFPALYAIVKEQAEKLKLRKTPAVYVLQADGALNAFATRFFWRNFVVIYSDVLETAYEQGSRAVEFIVGHELGHIKRHHPTKHVLLFPSFIVPFLNPAYSRACEYTCDRIGHALCPEGSVPGMLVLAAGKRLYSEIDVDALLTNARSERGFWRWFAEIVSSHPNLPKRVAAFVRFSAGDAGRTEWEGRQPLEVGQTH